MLQTLASLTRLSGLTGQEALFSHQLILILEQFGLTGCFADRLGNVGGYLPQGGEGPLVVVAAHFDEVGMLVTGIEPQGFLRMGRIAIDPRVLPGQIVQVHGKEILPGVVGVLPPHLINKGEGDKAVDMGDLFIDLGLPEAMVRAVVKVGDRVTFDARCVSLLGDRCAGKALDDRLGITVALEAAKLLMDSPIYARVLIALTAQEERGSQGARTLAQGREPDIAFVVDVTHAASPGVEKEVFGMDKPVLTTGPNVHPGLFRLMRTAAALEGIEYAVSVEPGITGTDAEGLQVAGYGVPCGILEIPLRYMHTPVELTDLGTAKKAARLLAASIRSIGMDWEDKLFC